LEDKTSFAWIVLRLRHDRFLTNPLHLINYQSSCHSTLYNMKYWSEAAATAETCDHTWRKHAGRDMCLPRHLFSFSNISETGTRPNCNSESCLSVIKADSLCKEWSQTCYGNLSQTYFQQVKDCSLVAILSTANQFKELVLIPVCLYISWNSSFAHVLWLCDCVIVVPWRVTVRIKSVFEQSLCFIHTVFVHY
jgi:hypothetical protein